MPRPSKKTTNGGIKDEPPITNEDQTSQDQNSPKESEGDEQRLKELQDQLQAKQKELEECRARAREKSLKQKIKEAEATLRHINEEIQSANNEVIHVDNPNSAAKTSQERSSLRSFISVDPNSPLSTNLQLAQWPLGYKFNMLPTFDGQSDPRQFLMSFEAAIISGGGDETTLAKTLVMTVKGPAQQWYSSLRRKSIQSWEQLKANLMIDFQGFQPTGLTTADLFSCKQQFKEPLRQYFRRFIQIKAQVPNVPYHVVIIVATKGLCMGQCASYFTREPPSTVSELYEVMQKFCKLDDDHRKRVEEESNF
jgi:hypothetical protein